MATSLKVLALDPGEKVGWARGCVQPDLPSFKLEDHGIADLKPFAVKLFEAISDYDVVIYETYRLVKKRNREGSDMPTSQLIGMIRMAGWLNPSVKMVAQSPNVKETANKTSSALCLEVADLLAREPGTHDDAHDLDGVRHLWYWYYDKYLKEALSGK